MCEVLKFMNCRKKEDTLRIFLFEVFIAFKRGYGLPNVTPF